MKNLFTLILLTISLNIFAQLQNTNWYFGDHAALNFNDGTAPPIVLNNSSMHSLEGSASVSDVNGQLLFYTNGETVWNKNHVTMPNGNGLLGHRSSTQSAIIVPRLKRLKQILHFYFKW